METELNNIRASKLKIVGLGLALVFMFCGEAFAQFDMKWIGGTGDWDHPANWDTGTVPTIDNTLLIPALGNDTVYIQPGVLAKARSLKIEPGMTLVLVDAGSILQVERGRIENQGSIINNALVHVQNTNLFQAFSLGNLKGHIENYGTIRIEHPAESGFYNYGEATFINHEGATLLVNASGDESIINRGSFVNHGSISCRNNETFGLLRNESYYQPSPEMVMVATFINTGDITLIRSESSAGIDNSGVFDNQGGTIKIDSVQYRGIYNRPGPFSTASRFTNSGAIRIGSGVGHVRESGQEAAATGIENSGSIFINETEGVVSIDSIGIKNLNVDKTGIWNRFNCTFINRGSLDITYARWGIRNNSRFENSGAINTGNMFINHFDNDGAEAVFTNTGSFATESVLGFARVGIANRNAGSALNSGEIRIEGLFNSGSVVNSPNSTITNTNLIFCSTGFINSGIVSNDDQAVLHIDAFQAVNWGASASFTNSGKINSKGGVTNDEGKFFNNGNIEVENPTTADPSRAGVTNQNGGVFENHAAVRLRNIRLHGIRSVGGATFVNTGQIVMQDTVGGDGIYNDSYFDNSGSISIEKTGLKNDVNGNGIVASGGTNSYFRNSGTINLGNGIERDGIRVASNFINTSSGIININSAGSANFPFTDGAAISLMDTLTNEGIIKIENEISEYGIKTRSDFAVFENMEGAEVYLDNTGSDGINFEKGYFNNSGRIVFGTGIAEKAMTRVGGDGIFTNLGSGHVWGVGSIGTAVFVNTGSIHPGLSPGIIEILDSYDHSSAIYHVEIAGKNGAGVPNGHDQIIVEDVGTLGGDCLISLIDGYTPDAGDSFSIMTCGGSCTGTFESVSLALDPALWDIEYRTNEIVLNFINPPPYFTSDPIVAATEDQLYTYDINVADASGLAGLTISATGLPAWLTLIDNGDGTGTLSGTPLNEDVGDVEITLTVTDLAGLSDEQSFTITVVNVNDAPAFTSDPVLTANEDALYTYNISAEDVDEGDALVISASTLPAWLTMLDNGDGTAVLSGTPTNEEVGLHNVVLVVTDVAGETDEQNFTIDVGGTNQAPQFTSDPVITGTENAVYSYTITATDQDAGDDIVISATGLPAWLTLIDNGDGTGTLSGTPLNEDVGDVEITLTVTDLAGLSDEQSFTITVVNVNDAPAFTSDPVLTANEDAMYTYNISAEDVDEGDALVINASTLPAWLTMLDNGDGTAVLSGTPTNEEVGLHSVVLVVTDVAGETDEQNFTIDVGGTNQAPQFTSDPVTTGTENAVYSYTITATDQDAGDDIVISATGLPAWLTLIDNGDGTGTLSGTPLNKDAGDVEITLTVTDLAGLSDEQSFTITVVNVNDAPAFTSDPVLTANEDALYTYDISAEDVDEGDALVISASTLPAWLTMLDNGDGTGTLSGTPLNEDVGDVEITLAVTDLAGLSDEQSFTITVVNVNDAPTFTSDPVLTANEDALYIYNISAEDVDEGDALVISASTLPAWLTMLDNGDGTAVLSGTPTNEEVGLHNVVLVVTDIAGESAEQNFTIDVGGTNQAPQFTSDPVTTGTENAVYSYIITATDQDAGDDIVISATGLPAWLTLIDNGDGTGTLSGTPLNEDVGDVEITLTVTDLAGLSDEQSFTITVVNVNDAPVFTSDPVLTANEDALYTYDISAEDVDEGDALVISASTLPAWLMMLDNGAGTAVLSGTPTNEEVGLHSVVLVVTDVAGETDEQSFTIDVGGTNQAPEFVSTPQISATEDEQYTYNITTSDADIGDNLTITGVLLPAWLTLVDNGDGTAILSGTPSSDEVGYIPITLKVTDDAGASDEQSFEMEVKGHEKLNTPPKVTSFGIQTNEDEPVVILSSNFIANYSDFENDPIVTISITSLPANGTLQLNGTTLSGAVEIPHANINSLSYVPDADFNGLDQFAWKASDEYTSATAEASVTITVTPVNDAPSDILLSNYTVEANHLPGDVVGTFTAVDPDLGDHHVFSFSSDNTNDISYFEIVDDRLITSGELDPGTRAQYEIHVTVTDSEGLTFVKLFEITIEGSGETLFQTGITPNNDGLNDTWRIDRMQNCPECVVNVFDRSGANVFNSVGYNREWDGTVNNEALPAGTYYYVIDFKDGTPPRKGTITILR